MTETPHLGQGTDITAADLDVEEPVDRPASSDPAEMVDGDNELGGVGGDNAGGAG